MECKFFVGQKVVRVDNRMTNGSYHLTGRYPEVDAVYTIRDIRPRYNDDCPLLLLAEIDNSHIMSPEPGFDHHRFRPATDISAFQETVRKVFAKKPAPPELVPVGVVR